MMIFRTLSGRFLLLTLIFVILAEVLILLPSVSRFRVEFIQDRLERSQMASLALLSTPSYMIDDDLEAELLANAGVLNVALKRDDVRQLFLSSPIPGPIEVEFDMRSKTGWQHLADAVRVLLTDGTRIVRVFGRPVMDAGELIDVVMVETDLRKAMFEYGKSILLLSAVISAATAVLLFAAVRLLMVGPISRLVSGMRRYAENPDDENRVIRPSETVTELFEAEAALETMQRQLIEFRRQKERLSNLGLAVANIGHDLAQTLSGATILADPDVLDEPTELRRRASQLVRHVERAGRFCESIVGYAKGQGLQLDLADVPLLALLEEVVEDEGLLAQDGGIAVRLDIPEDATARVDENSIYRVARNLIGNARLAMVEASRSGTIDISVSDAGPPGFWILSIADQGPGIAPRMKDRLFKPFSSSRSHAGGSGLGLPIAKEIVRAHGGELTLVRTGPDGTLFEVHLPMTRREMR